MMRYPSADPIDLLLNWISELSAIANMPELSLGPDTAIALRSILAKDTSRQYRMDSPANEVACNAADALRKLPLLDPLFVSAATYRLDATSRN